MSKPIEYNYRGERLVCATPGSYFSLRPFPSLPHIVVSVVEIDEAAQTITLADPSQTLTISFDLWSKMEPSYVHLTPG